MGFEGRDCEHQTTRVIAARLAIFKLCEQM